MEELNGRMIACQILVTGLIAKVANDSKEPLRFLTGFRDEIHAVVSQVAHQSFTVLTKYQLTDVWELGGQAVYRSRFMAACPLSFTSSGRINPPLRNWRRMRQAL